MKKLKCLFIVMAIGLVVFLTSATIPLTGDNGFMGKRSGLFCRGIDQGVMLNNLSDEQKKQVKKLRIEMMKKSIPVRNELNEKRARLRTLTTGDKVDFNEAEIFLVDIEKLKTEQAKQRVMLRVEIRNLLNDEQRVMYDAHVGMGKKVRGQSNFHKGNRQAMQGRDGRIKGRPCMYGKGDNSLDMRQDSLMDFTAEQQEQLKGLRTEQMKVMTQYRNELNVFKAKMKTITSADNVNLKEVDNMLNEMGKVKLEMAKRKLAHQQSVRAILNDEQRVMMDMRHRNSRF